MYNPIREEAKKLGYRVGSFDRRMGVTSISFNKDQAILGVDELGKVAGVSLEKELKDFFRF